MTIGLIDMIAIGILVFSVLFALYRGLVSELLGISSWIIAGLGALYSYSPMQPVMGKLIDNEKIAGICGALLVALVILVIMTIINSHIGRKLRQSSLSGLDRILGLVFGVLRGVILIALLYIGVTMVVSDKQMVDVKEQNITVPYIEKMVYFMKNFVPESVQEDLGITGDLNGEKPKKIGVDLKREHKLPEKATEKAVKRFVDSVAKEVQEKATDKKNKKNTETEVIDKATSESVPQYNAKEREGLDNLVENVQNGE